MAMTIKNNLSTMPQHKLTTLTNLFAIGLLLCLIGRTHDVVCAIPHFNSETEEYQMTSTNPKCERIKVELCSDIPYNQTIYPNLLKHTKQEEAEIDIKQYEMLVKVQCSPDFKFFLCTLFTPVCTILNHPIPPCRHLCLSAKNGCETLMKKFGYHWPEIFNCEKMPTSAEGMCVGENDNKLDGTDRDGSGDGDAAANKQKKPTLECPHTMKVVSNTRHSLYIANQTLEQCSLPCQNDGLLPTFFTAQMRHYLRLWIGALAVTCCVCCLFTIITFLIDLERFEFPERAILFIACSYLMVSSTFMVGLVAEDGLSCSVISATGQQLVTQGNENLWCSMLAAAYFYFSMTGALWWAVLCFSWFLVTTLKWGEAPVGQVFSSYFNGFVWLLPAFGLILVLAFGGIDGDVFSGICSIGNLQPTLLFRILVLPQAIIIGIGLVLFACGFISILRIRSYIKGSRFIANKYEHADASEKLGRLMIRISFFSLIYVLPMCVGLYAAQYQTQNMDQWLTNWYSTRCVHAQRAVFGFTQQREQCPLMEGGGGSVKIEENQPIPLLFFLKYLANFTCGIACAIWTLNGKTVTTYGDFFARIFFRADRQRGRPSRVPTRVH